MNVCELNIDQTVVIGDTHYRSGQQGYAIAIDASDSENDAKVTLRMPDGKLCTLSERDIQPIATPEPPAPRPLTSLTEEEIERLVAVCLPNRFVRDVIRPDSFVDTPYAPRYIINLNPYGTLTMTVNKPIHLDYFENHLSLIRPDVAAAFGYLLSINVHVPGLSDRVDALTT